MRLLFTGDTNFRMGEALTEEATRKILSPLWSHFEDADFRIINLETPLGYKDNYEPIYKAGPNLICDPENIAYLRGARVDVASMANNHSGDYGDQAVIDTIKLLDDNGIAHCGTGRNIAEAYLPAVLEKDGKTVSIFSICENEFGIAEENKPGSAGFEYGKIFSRIKEAKANTDYCIIFFHGGNEHNPLPSVATQERYRLLCDMGADAIIATHTHCPQGYEMYCGKPIVYSMGNFLFRSSVEREENDPWFYGYMVEMDIEDSITVKPVPYTFNQKLEYTNLENCRSMLEYIQQLSTYISDPQALRDYFRGWAWLHKTWIPKAPVGPELAPTAPGQWNLVHEESHRAKLDEVLRIYVYKEEELAAQWAEKITELMRMPNINS